MGMDELNDAKFRKESAVLYKEEIPAFRVLFPERSDRNMFVVPRFRVIQRCYLIDIYVAIRLLVFNGTDIGLFGCFSRHGPKSGT